MKTRRTTKLSGIAATSAAALLALAISSPAALGASLDVSAETISIVENFPNDQDAEISITVTNGESVLASDVYVVFEDGQEVSIGDVAPGGSAASAPVTRNIDSSEMPTHNFPVPVTLTFFLDGVYEELPASLTVELGGP